MSLPPCNEILFRFGLPVLAVAQAPVVTGRVPSLGPTVARWIRNGGRGTP